MDASGESEEKVLLPAQETGQQRKLRTLSQLGLTIGLHAPPAGTLEARHCTCRPPSAGAKAGLDQARFTAGIVRFYEAVLKEPVPEKMLSLVEEIAKRERGS